MGKTIIETKQVCRYFHKGNETVRAVENANLSANTADFICITGRSGSGKSTFLNILGLLDKPTQGTVIVNGHEIGPKTKLPELRRTTIGFIFQKFYLTEYLTVWENVALPLKYVQIPSGIRKERALEAIELVGMERRKNFKPTELSGGECQRIAIARAIVNRPQLLLADEPTSELDSHTAKEILSLLESIRRERQTAIIAVTHDKNVLNYGSKKLFMEDGYLKEVTNHKV